MKWKQAVGKSRKFKTYSSNELEKVELATCVTYLFHSENSKVKPFVFFKKSLFGMVINKKKQEFEFIL